MNHWRTFTWTNILLVLFSILLGFGLSVLTEFVFNPRLLQRSPIEKRAAAEAAIRTVLNAQAAAWNRGDLEGFMEGYWQSDELHYYSGKTDTQGWQTTLKSYRDRYQKKGKQMGKLAFDNMSIEMLGSDSAYVRGRWQLTLDREVVSGLFTLIFRHLSEGWRIVHDHTSK